MSKQRVAIVGASGYTGAELLRLLCNHPKVEVTALYAQRAAGTSIASIFPQFTGRLPSVIETLSVDDVTQRADIVFCGLPHGHSAEVVAELYARGRTVFDLSADYRLRDPDAYEVWYGFAQHPHPALLDRAVYGLVEFHRSSLPGAKLVAVPGCYPTSALLAVAPLVRHKLVDSSGLIIDAKSGVTGAGRNPTQATHFPEVGEGVRPYKIACHRHTPEIEQELGLHIGKSVRVTFTPHLVPMSRGILSCVYGRPMDDRKSAADYHATLAQAYAEEPFVQVLPVGQAPDTAHVRGSNFAHVAVALDERAGQVVAMCAIDNLVKGASGQAIQCMNLTQGWEESMGLTGTALFP